MVLEVSVKNFNLVIGFVVDYLISVNEKFENILSVMV